jgi:hypothetical protein
VSASLPLKRHTAAVAALFLLLCVASLGAQALPNADALPRLDPEQKAENPFLRFEIVSLGSYPITLFYTDFGFDLQRWVAKGYDSAYAPWPFKSTFSATLTDSERLTRLGVALGVSFAVGAVDAIIHASKVKAAKRLREARLSIDSSDSTGPQPSGTQ